MTRKAITLALGVAVAAALGAAPPAMAATVSEKAASRAALSKARTDARRGGQVLGVAVGSCRRVGARHRVCKVTTRVQRADGVRTCQIRYRVQLRGQRLGARRIAGSQVCTTTAPPAGSPAPAPAPAPRPPAGETKPADPSADMPGAASTSADPPVVQGNRPASGEEYDPFGESWGSGV